MSLYIKNKDGEFLPIPAIVGPQGPDGKSAYQYAQDGGYIGTEVDFAEKLAQTPLVGHTTAITPSQVRNAVESSRDVIIMYTDKTFGLFAFTAFDINVNVELVFSSAILQYNGMYAVVELIGDTTTNTWQFVVQQMATINDIPTNVSQLENDSGFLTKAPVTSVNNQTGAVNINIPTALPNPKTLTINGKSYNGSSDVNLIIDAGDAIPDYVRTEAERVATVVQSRKNADTVTFLVCSDLHHSYEISTAAQQTASIEHLGQAMSIVRQKVQVDFAAMLGDTVWDHGESVENALKSMRYVNSCIHNAFNGIPNLRTRGNHECLYNGAGLTDDQIFANIFAWNTGAKYDANNRLGGYCYRDFEDYKLRVICINTCESSDGSFVVSNTQNTWLQSALDLSAKGDGWRSIVLGHHPPDWVSSSSNLVQTLKAATGLIAVFHGHVHGFKVDKIPGTEITRIAIPNACFGRENEYGQNGKTENAEGTEFGEETTYGKTANTANDTAFCVVTIDLAEKKIYADHYGAGYSRLIPYNDVVLNSYTVANSLTNASTSNNVASVTEGASYSATLTPDSGYTLSSVKVTMGGADVTASVYNAGIVNIASVTGNVVITATAVESSTDSENYTNLVPTSLDYDLDGVFNGVGYKDGHYSTTDSPYYKADTAGSVVTGLIPYDFYGDDGAGYVTPPTIYIKGVTFDTAQSHNRIGLFRDDTKIMYSTQTVSQLSTYFTIETLGSKYYRLTPIMDGNRNVLAKTYGNQGISHFAISANGSGANMIVTLDEPIE